MMPPTRPSSTSKARAWEVAEGGRKRCEDTLATEEPMEIRLVARGERRPVAVTMRTPGHDFELAAGFLYNEGVVHDARQVRAITYCVDAGVSEQQRFNIVNVEVVGATSDDLAPLERHFSMTSACGVCGKATLEGLRDRGYERVGHGPSVEPEVICSFPGKLREAQKIFERTGGLHATGLFSRKGELLALREDVGRHNAMDKVVGWALMHERLPLAGDVLVVSGRASFELVQKSLSAGASILCSVSAPSSLAVELAQEFGLTLVGFLRGQRFKIYSCPERVAGAP